MKGISVFVALAVGLAAMFPAAVSAASQTCTLVTITDSESFQGGISGGRLRFLVTWQAVVDCPGDSPLDGRIVLMRDAAELQRSETKVVGTNRVELMLTPDGPTSVTRGAVRGSGSCSSTICTLELESNSAGDRLRVRIHVTLTVDRFSGEVLGVQVGNTSTDSGVPQ